MPSASSKRTITATIRRVQTSSCAWQRREQSRDRGTKAIVTKISQSSTSPPTSSPAAALSSRRLRTLRELSHQLIRKRYPYFTSGNDLELLSLSSGPYTGPPSGLVKWLDEYFAFDLADISYEELMKSAGEMLNEYLDVTGLEPEPGDPHIFSQPSPDSDYSIRLFPEPANSPFKFDLFCIPDASFPVPTGSGRNRSLRPVEYTFGILQGKIPPGEEKFHLRDGARCVLQRPGHRDVRFTVPIRRRPQTPVQVVDAGFLDFPKYID
ncbi:hypothetical protein BD414DRAFT_515312 [Trametes punicea]|nr:hypothetical protein BD414DRAFT_515312 [Trametes punicea]